MKTDHMRAPESASDSEGLNEEAEPTFRRDWRSPEQALSEFLAAIEIAMPGVAARSLIEEFGSVKALFAASWWQLRRVVGHRAASIIRSSRNLMRAVLAEPFERGPVVPRSREMIDFLKAELGSLRHERVLALYVDSKLRLIRVRKLGDGGHSGAELNIRQIIAWGLSSGASGFLIVHNHPSGDPTPSQADLAATSRLRSLAQEIDLHLLDHLIIAGDRVASIFEYWQEQERQTGAQTKAGALLK